jgi:hypothetical protein
MGPKDEERARLTLPRTQSAWRDRWFAPTNIDHEVVSCVTPYKKDPLRDIASASVADLSATQSSNGTPSSQDRVSKINTIILPRPWRVAQKHCGETNVNLLCSATLASIVCLHRIVAKY